MGKKCAEFSTNEAGRKFCARFDNVEDDIAVAQKDGDESLGYFDIGDVTKAMGALKGIGAADVVPPLVGGIGAVVTTLLIRRFTRDKVDSLLNKWATVGGMVGGVLCSIPLYWLYGKAGVIKGALGGVVVGGGLLVMEKIGPKVMTSGMGLHAVNVRGMGAAMAYEKPRPRLGAAYIPPTARVPGGVASAMDVGAFAGPKNTYGMGGNFGA
jgi:hypothetical protein